MGAVQIIRPSMEEEEELSPSKLQLSGLLVFSHTTPHSTAHLWQIWFTQITWTKSNTVFVSLQTQSERSETDSR